MKMINGLGFSFWFRGWLAVRGIFWVGTIDHISSVVLIFCNSCRPDFPDEIWDIS